MEYDAVVIHFGEIWLKGRNRAMFVRRLYDNVAAALQGETYDALKNERDRFVLYLNDKSDLKGIEERLANVFGISWFAPALMASNSLNEIVETASRALAGRSTPVRIVASRSYKGCKFTSEDIVQAFLKAQGGLGFVLDKDAEEKLFINVRKDDAIICTARNRGLGGLPIGTSGRAVVLLSGGIDSPVASFYAMKKGLSPIYLHVHGFPNNDEAAASKIKDMVGVLSRYSGRCKVYYAPAHVFHAAVTKAPKSQELVLFKRFLYALGERVAKRENAVAMVTGESLGQVASQTPKNLTATQRGIELLVFRPLIGFDKEEIIGMARRLGTYGISILEYPDVCAMRARHPDTAADGKKIGQLWDECGLDAAMEETMKKLTIVRLDR